MRLLDLVTCSQKYSIIYADPPWSYKDKALAGNRGAGCHYQTQGLEWIKSLPVASLAAEDSCLFLWATAPLLPEALQVMDSWGFGYKTVVFTWVKRNPKAGTWFWGMGNWTRSNPEYCLLGVRGRPKRVSKGVHSVCDAVIGRHSAKPAEIRTRIEALMGDLPRLELFAREEVSGWDCFGNEV